MPRSKNRWAATSKWQSIVVVTPTGKVEELTPDTPVYFTTKKQTIIRTVADLLDSLFEMGLHHDVEDPFHHAVRCISTMAVVKQMKIHDPRTGKLIGKASLTPPRKMMH